MKIQNFHIFLSDYVDIAHIISAFNTFFAIKFEAIDFEDEDAVGFILFHTKHTLNILDIEKPSSLPLNS